MLTSLQSALLVSSIVAASILCLWILHRVWPSERRRQHNDLIGWQITVVGTTYAVIIAFMLYAVWTDFEVATDNAEAEADSLVNVARLARGLPQPQGLKVQALARAYAENMLTEEWPAMEEGRFSPTSVRITEELWTILTTTEARGVSEQTSLDHALSQLSTMTEERRHRYLQATNGIPGILWTVLAIGAIITIVSSCLFGSADFRLHLLQVLMLSLILSLLLAAIADISRPFRGSVHVSASGFERARATLRSVNSDGS